MSMPKDIKTYLAGQGVTDEIYIGYMPDRGAPDQCVALYAYAGQPPLISAELRIPGLQVRVRAASGGYSEASDLIESIAGILKQVGDEVNEGAGSQAINGTTYHRIIPVQEPFELGQDDSERYTLVQNFYVTLKG